MLERTTIHGVKEEKKWERGKGSEQMKRRMVNCEKE
jgi:hypothetical protein